MMNQKVMKEAYRNELVKKYGDKTDMIDFCMKEASVIVPLDRGMAVVEKDRIEKDFCFGYGLTHTYDEASRMEDEAEASQDYFIAKNLEGVNWTLKRLEDADKIYIYRKYYGNAEIYDFMNIRPWDVEDGMYRGTAVRKATNEEVEALREGYREEKRKFEKRLHTYLKRYGLSKIHTWTYDQND